MVILQVFWAHRLFALPSYAIGIKAKIKCLFHPGYNTSAVAGRITKLARALNHQASESTITCINNYVVFQNILNNVFTKGNINKQ